MSDYPGGGAVDLVAQGRSQLRDGDVNDALGTFETAVGLASERLTDAPDDPMVAGQYITCCYWRAAALIRLRLWPAAEYRTHELVQLASDTHAAHYARGRYYLEAGGFDDAIACFEQALAYDPEHERSLRDRVRALRRSGLVETACESAESAVARIPDSLPLRSELVSALLAAGRYAEADKVAIDANNEFPGRAETLVMLARVQIAQNDHVASESYLTEALRINPRHDGARSLQTWLTSHHDLAEGPGSTAIFEAAQRPAAASSQAQPAGPTTEEVIESLSAKDDPDQLIVAASLLSDKQDFSEALRTFSSAVVIDPASLAALCGQVSNLRLLGKYPEAITTIEEAIERYPAEWSLYVERGRVCHDQEQFDDALAWFERAATKAGGEIESCVATSVTLCVLGRYDEASRRVSTLLTTYPRDVRLLAEQAWIATGERRFAEADYLFDRLRTLSASGADRAQACYGRGCVAFAQGDFEGARSFFEQAQDAAPDVLAYRLAVVRTLAMSANEDEVRRATDECHQIIEETNHTLAYVVLGIALQKRGQLRQAQHYLERAFQINPALASHAELGALYAAEGDADRAEQEFRAAIATREPGAAAIHYELGRLLLSSDDDRTAVARTEFMQALAIDPAFPHAAIGLAVCNFIKDRVDAAEQELRAAIRRCQERDSWLLHALLTRLLLQRGDEIQRVALFEEAYGSAQAAINLAPTAAEPHYLAGLAQLQRGNYAPTGAGRSLLYSSARKHFASCLQLDPDHSAARRAMAVLEPWRGEFRKSMLRSAPVGVGGMALVVCAIFYLVRSFGQHPPQLSFPIFLGMLALGGGMTIIFALPDNVKRLKAAAVFDMEFNPRDQAVSFGPVGGLAVGIDRFDLPSRPAGEQFRRGDG